MSKIFSVLFVLCSTQLMAQPIFYKWTKVFGGTGNDIPVQTISDDAGNIYTLGIFAGTVDFDPGSGVFNLSASTNAFYIQKLDSSGNFLDAHFWGDGVGADPAGVALDDSLNIYIAGTYGSGDFDPGPGILIPLDDDYTGIFVLKIDSAGNAKWVRGYGGDFEERCGGIALDGNSNVYTTGYSYSTGVDFDPSPATYNLLTADENQFVHKLDRNGNFEWAHIVSKTGSGHSPRVITDENSFVYVIGRSEWSDDIDPGPAVLPWYPPTTTGSVYILKLDTNANFYWVRSIDKTMANDFDQIKFDVSGNMYIAGLFFGTMDADTGPGIHDITAIGNYDYYLSKINSDGSMAWIQQTGSSGENVEVRSMDVKDGFIYVTGIFSHTIDFDPGLSVANLTASTLGSFIQKLDTSGNHIWAYALNNIEISCNAIILQSDQSIMLSGSFEGTGIDLNPLPAVNTYSALGSSTKDVFITKFSQKSCASFTAILDSVHNVMCVQDGYASSHGLYGVMPYNYSWNTSPIVNDSSVNFSTPGTYTLTVTDSIACVVQKTICVFGPGYIANIDLSTNLVVSSFRPSFNSQLWLDGFNDGCDPVSGTMSIVLDPLVTFNSAIPAPDVISGDTLQWNFTSLTYDSAHITPQIDVTTSAGAVIGDSICFTVMITPVTGDADTTNNNKHYCFPVVNGYDPNDKQVYPQGECEDRIVAPGQKMTYTVRFQNTGNAEAINIYILDSLDSDLDLNSIRVIGNSHNLITEVLPGNVLKFRFDNIHLPDSTSDESNSHGYVIYEVDQQPGLSSGTLLENTAYIYFDFNPSIITNTVTNKVGTTGLPCDIVTSNQEKETVKGLKIYPNPANESITVFTEGTTAQNINLLDLYGRQILNVQPTGTNTVINLSALQKGIYFVKVKMSEGQRIFKIIKE